MHERWEGNERYFIKIIIKYYYLANDISIDFVSQNFKAKCVSCTPKQKENADKTTDFLKKNYPTDWIAIEAKYGA